MSWSQSLFLVLETASLIKPFFVLKHKTAVVGIRENRICLQSPDKYIPVLLQLTDQKKRHLRTLAEMHYNKAVRFFTLVDSSVEILRAQLERVALAEFQLNSEWSFFTARQRSCEKVMFSYVSFQSDCRGGPHVTIANDTLDRTV